MWKWNEKVNLTSTASGWARIRSMFVSLIVYFRPCNRRYERETRICRIRWRSLDDNDKSLREKQPDNGKENSQNEVTQVFAKHCCMTMCLDNTESHLHTIRTSIWTRQHRSISTSLTIPQKEHKHLTLPGPTRWNSENVKEAKKRDKRLIFADNWILELSSCGSAVVCDRLKSWCSRTTTSSAQQIRQDETKSRRHSISFEVNDRTIRRSDGRPFWLRLETNRREKMSGEKDKRKAKKMETIAVHTHYSIAAKQLSFRSQEESKKIQRQGLTSGSKFP